MQLGVLASDCVLDMLDTGTGYNVGVESICSSIQQTFLTYKQDLLVYMTSAAVTRLVCCTVMRAEPVFLQCLSLGGIMVDKAVMPSLSR